MNKDSQKKHKIEFIGNKRPSVYVGYDNEKLCCCCHFPIFCGSMLRMHPHKLFRGTFILQQFNARSNT